MRRLFIFAISLLLSLPLSLVWASPAHSEAVALSITELLPDPASPQTDADHEFVEIFNSSSESVSLAGFKLQIKSATAANPTTKPLSDISVPAGGYAVITSAQAGFALSNSGATVSLLDAGGSAYGDTTTYPKAVTGAAWALGSAGWSWTVVPTSGSANTIVVPTPAPAKTGSASSSNATTSYSLTGATSTASADNVDPQNYGALLLTELLPDPASPQTDAADEYIEFYNSGTSAIDLTGIVVKTGSALGTKHALKGGIVEPGSYLALKIADTKVSLANGGSSIALFSPDGEPIGATVTYPKATAGAAWARDGDTWSWTSTPTPGAANHLTVKSGTTSTTNSTTVNKSFAPSSGLAPAASKAAALAKSAGEAATAPSASWLIFTLLGLTLVYCIYEFRYDLQRIYHRLRGHSAISGQSGTVSERRPHLGIGQRFGRWQNHFRARLGHRLGFWRRSRQPDLRDQPSLPLEV